MEELFVFAQNYCTTLLITIISIGITSFLLKLARKEPVLNDKSHIPGRLGLPFLGETVSFLLASNSGKGCYEFVRLRYQRHGKWFQTRIFGKIHVFVPTTEAARTVYANEFVNFNKGYLKPMGDMVGKKSLFSVPHESHKKIRRLLSDPFSMDSLPEYVTKFDIMLSQRLSKLEAAGKSFRLLDFCMKVNFDSMCNMLMSVTEESLLQQIRKDCNDVSSAMLSIPVMVPGTKYYKGIKARRRLMQTFREIIERKRSALESSVDFLQSMLQRHSYPLDEKLDDTEITDNLLTLILSGMSTTPAAMMWSVKFLDDNREVQDRLREEQLSLARNKKEGASLTLKDVKNMAYGLKVVKETLRMSNIVLWYPRVALNDCKIEGFEIKKGWHVDVDAAGIHYDPVSYKEPLQFNPSRFDDMQKPYSFIPFGLGSRTCLGMNMAKVTMLILLHRLTSGYKWTVDDSDPALEKKSFIPQLKSGYPITLKAFNDSNQP